MFDPAVSESDGALALEKIFGPRHRFRFRGRLPGLDELKKAFRLQSLRLHPDRARALGRTEALLTREFQSVNEAYRLLLPIIARRGRHPPAAAPKRTVPPTSPSPPPAAPDFFWKMERLPPVKLRFAQFLYYKGLVSFNTLIRAIVWQSGRRPRSGELAQELGALAAEEVRLVLGRKRVREPFLTAAVRLGFMDEPARRRVLAAQRSLGLPIGRFFVEEGILTPDRLAGLLAECGKHNHSVA